MSKQSLILYRIERLPEGRKTIKTEERRPRGFRERDTALAYTSLKLSEKSVTKDYCEAVITHRDGIPLQGWWRDTRIREFVAVFDMRAFYSRRKKLFLIASSYTIAKSAVTRLNREKGGDVLLRPVRLDSAAIAERAKTIVGAWSMSPDSPIRTRAAFGDDLASNADFQRMSGDGEFSNISLRYPFEEGELRISVSRAGSCFFFEKVPEDKRLRFMEHLALFEAKPEQARRSRRAEARR